MTGLRGGERNLLILYTKPFRFNIRMWQTDCSQQLVPRGKNKTKYIMCDQLLHGRVVQLRLRLWAGGCWPPAGKGRFPLDTHSTAYRYRRVKVKVEFSRPAVDPLTVHRYHNVHRLLRISHSFRQNVIEHIISISTSRIQISVTKSNCFSYEIRWG